MKDEHAEAIIEMLRLVNTNLISITVALELVAAQIHTLGLSEDIREMRGPQPPPAAP